MATSGRRSKKSTGSAKSSDMASKIVDTALDLACETGWGALSLHEVAASRNLSLSDLRLQFRDKDAIADAWFDRALAAMLEPMPKKSAEEPVSERLHMLLVRWFDALAPYRAVTCQMLDEKMHLPHPHHWAPMVFNLSRLIQWLRDAALLEAQGGRRQIEEIGLTAVFLATLAVWRRDSSPEQERTKEFLRRRLVRADRTMACLFRQRAV